MCLGNCEFHWNFHDFTERNGTFDVDGVYGAISFFYGRGDGAGRLRQPKAEGAIFFICGKSGGDGCSAEPQLPSKYVVSTSLTVDYRRQKVFLRVEKHDAKGGRVQLFVDFAFNLFKIFSVGVKAL